VAIPTSKAWLRLGVGDIDADDGASAAPCAPWSDPTIVAA
jgi:hypothetical protein